MALEIYTKVRTIKESPTKKIDLVLNEIDRLYYIKKNADIKYKEIYQIIKNISNPHLPKIYEILEQENEIIIIEQYINSVTLDEYLLNNSLTKKQIITIMNQLCDALSQLHAHHIIHRDIKPENIFYDGTNIILFDFDIARIHHDHKNQDTTIFGSVGYAAPEQFGFKQTDERTDVYALGVLLNYMFTKKLPNECLYQGKEKLIIEKAIYIDPNQRYKSVEKMKHDLNHISKDWTIPGFRQNKLSHKVIAVISYLSIIYFVYTSQTEGIEKWSLEDIILNILILLIILIMIAFITNYMNIKDYCLFHNNRYKIIRICGIILTYVLIITLLIIVVSIIEGMMGII